MLKFYAWISHEKEVDTYFSPIYAPFLSPFLFFFCPLQKIRMKSSQQNISKLIEAGALKLGEWIGSEE